MTIEIRDERPPATQPPFRLPADYYAGDLSGVRPIFPRWVPFGCGTAALLFILLLVGAGAWLAGGGGVMALDWTFGQFQTDLKPLMAKEVTPQQKAAFDAELTTFRANLKAGRIGLPATQPVLLQLQQAMSDQKVSADELRKINDALHAANAGQGKKLPGRALN